MRAIQILSRPDIEIPLFPTNRSPIAIQPCAGSGGVPKVPSVRAKGGGEFAFSLVGHSKPTPTSQPAPLRLAACSPYKSQPSPHLGRQGALPEARGVSTTMCGGLSTTPLAQPPHHRPTSAAICSARSGAASRGVCAITAWAHEWLAGPDNQRSTAPSTPLAQPLHHRPTSAAICSALGPSRRVCTIAT